MKKLLIALFLFPVTLVVAVPSAKPRLGEAPVRKIVAAMSLEEKAGLWWEPQWRVTLARAL